MKKMIIVLLFVLAGCSSGQLIPSLSQTTIDWVDLVQWNDSMYVNNHDVNSLKQEWQTGKELGVVTFMMDGKAGTHHKVKNGDATYLPKGTKIYEMAGYDPAFRIIADGRVFEVDEPAEAETLGDFLDIDGKVESVTFLDYGDDSIVGQLSDDEAQPFIEELLALDYQAYDTIYKETKGQQIFVEIALSDGTTTRTGYYPDSNIIRYGAFVSEKLTDIIEQALAE